jgi:BirA family biotin operon repressor/biotin-[acetyl-CoA-carboxylase] ligase
MEPLRAADIAAAALAGVQVEDKVDSTNLRLKEAARAGQIRPPYLLAAEEQTAGRGRLGRQFVSPPGTGLYMSLLAAPDDADPGKITLAAAAAVCRAIEEMTPLTPRIKWVNDIFVRGRKVCGILAEKIGQGVVVGVGVNVLTPPGGFPPEAGAAGALDAEIDRSELAGRIGAHLLMMLANPEDPSILAYYRSRMPLIGKEITFTQQGQTKKAHVTGVGEDGALLIEGDEGPQALRSGEIPLGSQSYLGLE